MNGKQMVSGRKIYKSSRDLRDDFANSGVCWVTLSWI